MVTTQKIVKTWDISGFDRSEKGGLHYENSCQKLLWTGVKYMQEIHEPQTFFSGMTSSPNIFGVLSTPERMKELEELMSKAVNGDWTGAQHQIVFGHLEYIGKHGYENWFNYMKEHRRDEQCLKFDLEMMELIT
jgi:hypothetical protein